jgi:hypothetical protein
LREVETPTFSDIGLTDGGKVVSPTHHRILTLGRFLVLTSVKSLSRPQAMVQLEGLSKLKKIYLIRDSNRRPSGL